MHVLFDIVCQFIKQKSVGRQKGKIVDYYTLQLLHIIHIMLLLLLLLLVL